MTSCLIEDNFVDREIDSLGEDVTLRVVTKSSYSKWGDASESTSDNTIKAFVNVLSADDQEVKEGIFKAGDIRIFVKTSQSIKRGDRIKYSNEWYQVDEVISQNISGGPIMKQVRVTKV